ncbi:MULTISPECIES: helix-turn-helix transcriptional regulator [unclassified Gordonia (in: high G+C Gram-positive bacteria)]|uniref:helix-turn-helix domain-containing protein n=1 Tax=unclassified Gordonia (in: high G+C Gram-positive bacteria) TaxID=2657482 RepID=UPI0023DD1FAE|nr:helix-turn-helix transcriptional regulator [Gordonia sp. PDNC005]
MRHHTDRRTAFSARLRTLRTSAGLTQERLAERAGFDRSFYVEIEHGKHSLLLDRVFDLAETLDVEIVELFRFQSSAE